MYFGLLAGKSRAGKSVESVSAVFRRRGLRYLALALVDVEATYLTQRAMQYTTLVSIQVRLLLMSHMLFGKNYNTVGRSVTQPVSKDSFAKNSASLQSAFPLGSTPHALIAHQGLGGGSGERN